MADSETETTVGPTTEAPTQEESEEFLDAVQDIEERENALSIYEVHIEEEVTIKRKMEEESVNLVDESRVVVREETETAFVKENGEVRFEEPEPFHGKGSEPSSEEMEALGMYHRETEVVEQDEIVNGDRSAENTEDQDTNVMDVVEDESVAVYMSSHKSEKSEEEVKVEETDQEYGTPDLIIESMEKVDESNDKDEKIVSELPPVVVEKRPMSLHMESVFGVQENTEVQRPIEEDAPIVVEKQTVSLQMEPIFDQDVGNEEDEEDKNDHEYELDDTQLAEDDTNLQQLETVLDPIVEGHQRDVEKESAHVPAPIEDTLPVIVEKRPVSLHMERVFDDEEVEEVSPVVIEKRPLSLHMEAVFGEDGPQEKAEEEDNAEYNYVRGENQLEDSGQESAEETVPGTLESTEDSEETEYQDAVEGTVQNDVEKEPSDGRETILESPPVVIQKRPVSLHMEAVLEEHDEVPEPIEDASPVVVEKRPVSLHMEAIFGADVRDEMAEEYNDDATEETVMETESEKVEQLLKRAREFAVNEPSEVGESVEEASPVMVEKRPVSLHMESLFYNRETRETREPVEESPLIAVEKEPVSCQIDQIFDVSDEMAEENKDEVNDDTAKTQVVDTEFERVEEMLKTSEEAVEYEADKQTSDESGPTEEASHVVVETSTVSFYMESTVTEDFAEAKPEANKEGDIDETAETYFVAIELERADNGPGPAEEVVQEITDKRTTDLEEPIEEAPLVVLEKRPLSLHMERMFDGEVVEQELKENEDDHSGTAETQFAETELEKVEKILERESDVLQDEETETRELIEETSPVVEEKRSVSLHMEAVFDLSEGEAKQDNFGDEDRNDDVQVLDTRLERVEKTLEADDNPSPDVNESTDEVEKGTDVAVVSSFETTTGKDQQREKAEKDEDSQLTFTETVAVAVQPESDNQSVEDREIVNEVVENVVERKPVLIGFIQNEQSDENHENAAELEPAGIVLDVPHVEDRQETPDYAQETVDPAVVKTPAELQVELLIQANVEELDVKTQNQEVEESSEVVDRVANEEGIRIVENVQDVESQPQPVKRREDKEMPEPVKETGEETEKWDKTEQQPDEAENQLKEEERQEAHQGQVMKTEEIITTETVEGDTKFKETVHTKTTVQTITTKSTKTPKEKVSLISYTKRNDDSRLPRQLLKKRLSAPEVLPEKESEGPAPLAASEDRGILESREQFLVEPPSREKDNNNAKPNAGGTTGEPDTHVSVSPKEDAGSGVPPVETEGAEGSPDSDLPHLILITPEEDAKEGKKKKRKKGKKNENENELSSPRAKCCSLM